MFNDDHRFMSDLEMDNEIIELQDWDADFDDYPDFDDDYDDFQSKLDNDPAYHEWLDEMGK